MNETELAAGDIIRLLRGDRFAGMFLAPSSGTNNDPIIIEDYGDDEDPPLLDAGDIKLNASFTHHSGNAYQVAHTPASADYMFVYEAGTRLTPKTTIQEVIDTPGSSHYAAGVLTVHDSNSSNVITNGVEYIAGTRLAGIHTNARSHLIIRNLAARHTCGHVGGIAVYGSNISVSSCSSTQNGDHSGICGGTDCLIDLCTFGPSSGSLFVHFQATRSILRRSTIDGSHTWGSNLVQIHGTGSGNSIEYSDLVQSVLGSGVDDIGLNISDATNTGNTVRFNRIRGYLYGGLRVGEESTGNEAYGNVLHGPTFRNYGISCVGGGVIEALYNNSIYAAGVDIAGVSLDADSSIGDMKNNAIWCGFPVSVEDRIRFSNANHNQYHSHRAERFLFEGPAVNFADWKAGTAQDANSAEGDPLWKDPANGDLSLLSAASPLFGTGENLGASYNGILGEASVWPAAVTLLNQATAWNKGAFTFAPPRRLFVNSRD